MMKISLAKKTAFIALVLAATLLVASCPDEGGEAPAEPEPPTTVKLNRKGQRVVQTTWMEQGVDPRVTMGYLLEDDTPFFDHFVQLYGLRLRDNNCAADTDSPATCRKTGVHWCCMDLIYNRMFRDYETHVKPVRDRGLKYLVSLVPEGVAVGMLYRWPMEKWYPWKEITGQDVYPYGPETVAKLITELKEIDARTPFDGIAYDEEYGGEHGGYPAYPEAAKYPKMSTNDTSEAWRIGGENIIRFAHEVNQAFGRKLIQETYEIRYAGKVPVSYTYDDGAVIYRNDVIDYSYEAYYGSWQPESGNVNFPRRRYGPGSIDLGFDPNTPQPPPGFSAGSGITGRMQDHLEGNYGVVMYYHQVSREYYLKNRPNYFGPNDAPLETYLSEISRILYGQKTKYVGRDYGGD
jgi:hypothetical protein